MKKSYACPVRRTDLANMRRQGVHHLIAYCLNDSCRHQVLNLEPLVVAEIKVGLGAVIGHDTSTFLATRGSGHSIRTAAGQCPTLPASAKPDRDSPNPDHMTPP